jgi:hypothetical protein
MLELPHLTRPEGDRSLDPMYPVLPRFSYIIFAVHFQLQKLVSSVAVCHHNSKIFQITFIYRVQAPQ